MRERAQIWATVGLFGIVLLQGCLGMKEIYQQGLVKLRTPGQHMVESCESTLKRSCCPPYRKNEVYLEQSGAIPEQLFPGEEVNHRIRYAFCPQKEAAVLRARLVRRVLYHGREVFSDVSNQVFCAGTWNVDAFIRVPRHAPPGRYVIKLEIYCDGKTIKRTNSFTVKREPQPGSYHS